VVEDLDHVFAQRCHVPLVCLPCNQNIAFFKKKKENKKKNILTL
jgi:hypothetical protein